MPDDTPSYRLPTVAEIDQRLEELKQEAKVLRYLKKQITAGKDAEDEDESAEKK